MTKYCESKININASPLNTSNPRAAALSDCRKTHNVCWSRKTSRLAISQSKQLLHLMDAGCSSNECAILKENTRKSTERSGAGSWPFGNAADTFRLDSTIQLMRHQILYADTRSCLRCCCSRTRIQAAAVERLANGQMYVTWHCQLHISCMILNSPILHRVCIRCCASHIWTANKNNILDYSEIPATLQTLSN